MVPVAAIFVGICILFLAVRILHLASSSGSPQLHFTSSTFNDTILQHCPLLNELYIPPLLWGKSGHIQSIVYAKKGRFRIPVPSGSRHSFIMEDGATLTYDIFDPIGEHPSKEDLTMVVCPGIANSSESEYIRTFIDYSQKQGYRVVVLNHLGAIRTIPLTSPRMFTYGGTQEYAKMLDIVRQEYPETRLVGVGFSMGGNVMAKYLGEDEKHQERFLCAISCCQGYDAARCLKYTTKWEHLRRGYNWAMVQNQKKFLRAHKEALFGVEAEKCYGKFDYEKLLKVTCLQDLDELYSRRRAGYNSLEEYYTKESCVYFLDSISIPMFILNALDDPLIPNVMHDIPMRFASERENVIFAVTKHGGHLGYFEGGMVLPESVTWLDKVVVQYANAALLTTLTVASQPASQ